MHGHGFRILHWFLLKGRNAFTYLTDKTVVKLEFEFSTECDTVKHKHKCLGIRICISRTGITVTKQASYINHGKYGNVCATFALYIISFIVQRRYVILKIHASQYG